MLDHGRIHQGHVREIRDFSTAPRNTSAQPGNQYGVTSRCLGNDHDISVAGSWRDVTLQKTYPLQTRYEHNMLSLLHAVCLKVLVFFFTWIRSWGIDLHIGGAFSSRKSLTIVHVFCFERLMPKIWLCSWHSGWGCSFLSSTAQLKCCDITWQ